MTRRSTSARAALLDHPGIACIARFHVAGEPVDFPVGEDDLAADATWAGAVLAGHGVERGHRAVVAALTWESAWFEPLRIAMHRMGGAFSNTETWEREAGRLDMFLRRLTPDVVAGPGSEMIAGLAAVPGAFDRLRRVRLLLVRPAAAALLEGTGVVVPVGPTLGLSHGDGGGIVVDPAQWEIAERDGELVVSSTAARMARFDHQPTGLRGRVERRGGLPRVVLS